MDGDPARERVRDVLWWHGLTLCEASLALGRNVAYLHNFLKRRSPRVLTYPKAVLRHEGGARSESLRILRVQGESMGSQLQEGDRRDGGAVGRHRLGGQAGQARRVMVTWPFIRSPAFRCAYRCTYRGSHAIAVNSIKPNT